MITPHGCINGYMPRHGTTEPSETRCPLCILAEGANTGWTGWTSGRAPPVPEQIAECRLAGCRDKVPDKYSDGLCMNHALMAADRESINALEDALAAARTEIERITEKLQACIKERDAALKRAETAEAENATLRQIHEVTGDSHDALSARCRALEEAAQSAMRKCVTCANSKWPCPACNDLRQALGDSLRAARKDGTP